MINIPFSYLAFTQDKLDASTNDAKRIMSDSADFWGSFVNMVVVLLVVVGFIILLGWFMRRLNAGVARVGNRSGMRMLENISLGNKQYISLLKVGKKHILLGITQNQITKLEEFEESDIEEMFPKQTEAQNFSFSSVLEKITGKDKRSGDE